MLRNFRTVVFGETAPLDECLKKNYLVLVLGGDFHREFRYQDRPLTLIPSNRSHRTSRERRKLDHKRRGHLVMRISWTVPL